MNEKTLARLRRLGVVKGARKLKSSRPLRRPDDAAPRPGPHPTPAPRPAHQDGDPQPVEKLLPGLDLVTTADGACFVRDKVYPLSYRHGTGRLEELLAHSPAGAAPICQDDRFADLDVRDFVFLDTETTGLHGAGTIAFMVGVGFFQDDAFVVRQYFLRDHGDEPAMLLLLDDLLAERPALVTFNGRSFDLPLLDNRYLMNRLPADLLDRPHLDLLPPSRRLWRYRLGSCALGSLEQNLLGVQRTHEDVPGWLIPGLYHQYLQTGDGREMVRVFYHNRLDMLSMVTLAARVLRQFTRPGPGDPPLDLLGLGRWQADLGLTEEAERSLRLAAVPEMPTEMYQKALQRLGTLLKREERREEAVEVWQQLACTSFDDVTGHVELAKHYEWHAHDLDRALQWTEQALALIGPAGVEHDELAHRRDRLQRKRARRTD